MHAEHLSFHHLDAVLESDWNTWELDEKYSHRSTDTKQRKHFAVRLAQIAYTCLTLADDTAAVYK